MTPSVLSLDNVVQMCINKSVLIVTSSPQRLDIKPIKVSIDAIKNSSDVCIFCGVKPYPQKKELEDFVSDRNLDYEYILAIGGGSTLDFAKMIKYYLYDSSFSNNLDEISPAAIKRLPSIVAIPSIPGSGAEVTQFAAVWDKREDKKYSYDYNFLQPSYVCYVPEFISSLPQGRLDISMLDCFSHAIDSIFNINSTQDVISNSLKAVNLLLKYLQHPRDSVQPDDLFYSSYLAGKSINKTRTSLTHALSYQFTLKYDIPHGVATSMFIPSVLNFMSKHDLRDSNLTKALHQLNEVQIEKLIQHTYLDLGLKDLLEHIEFNKISRQMISDNTRFKNSIIKPDYQSIEKILSETKNTIRTLNI